MARKKKAKSIESAGPAKSARSAGEAAAAPADIAFAAVTPGGFGRDLANWLFPGFLLIVLAGFFGIWKFGSSAGEINPVRSMFLAMCSATCTSVGNVSSLNEAGQSVSLLLIVAGSLFSMIVGSLAVIRITRMRFTDRDVVLVALVVEGIALLVGSSLLWDAQRSPFQAMYLAASSFGNCGMAIGDLPQRADMPLHLVILPLTVLGGIGLPVIMDLWCLVVFQVRVSEHSRWAMQATAWIYVASVVVLLLVNQPGHAGYRASAVDASILSIESRSGGLAVVPMSSVAAAGRWIIVALMIIGASPAGTGGGLKTTTFVELWRGARALLAGRSPGRPMGIALMWVAIFALLALGAMMLLGYVSGVEPGDNIAFNALSALGNVGFTAVPMVDEKGLFFAYSAIMLVGKMAPMMVIWWMADTTSGAEMAIG